MPFCLDFTEKPTFSSSGCSSRSDLKSQSRRIVSESAISYPKDKPIDIRTDIESKDKPHWNVSILILVWSKYDFSVTNTSDILLQFYTLNVIIITAWNEQYVVWTIYMSILTKPGHSDSGGAHPELYNFHRFQITCRKEKGRYPLCISTAYLAQHILPKESLFSFVLTWIWMNSSVCV